MTPITQRTTSVFQGKASNFGWVNVPMQWPTLVKYVNIEFEMRSYLSDSSEPLGVLYESRLGYLLIIMAD